MSSTGGYGEQPIIMRMHMSGTAQFVGDTEAMIAALKGLQAEMAQLTAASRANAAAMTAQGNATAAAAAKDGAAAKKSGSMLAAASKGLKSTGQSMKLAGEKLTRGVTVPLVALGTVAIKSSLNFHRAMLLVQTSAGATHKDMLRLTALAEKRRGKADALGPFSAMDLAKSAYVAESVGYTVKGGAVNLIRAAAQTALAGGANVRDVTSAIAAAKKTGIRGTQGSFRSIGANLLATAGAGNMTLEELVQAYGTGLLTNAKKYGLSLTDLNAALALASDEGTKPSYGAARLRTGIQYLTVPNDKATKALSRIGLKRFDIAQAMRDAPEGFKLAAALKLFNEHLAWVRDPNKRAGVESAVLPPARGAIISSLGGQTKNLDSKIRQIDRTTGDFGKHVRESLNNPKVKLQTAIENLKKSFIALGDVLAPIVLPLVTKVLGVFTSLASGFASLSPGVRRFIIYGALLFAAIGPVLVVLGMLLSTIGFFISPLGLVVLAIIGLTLAGIYLYTHFKIVRDIVHWTGQGIGWFWGILKQVASWIGGHWKLMVWFLPFAAIPLLIKKNWNKIKDFFAMLIRPWIKDAKIFIGVIKHLLGLLHVDLGGGAPKPKPKQVVGRFGTGASLFGPNVQGGTVNTHWSPLPQPNRHLSRGANPISPNPIFNPFGTEPLVQDIHLHTHLGEREVAKSVTRQTILSKMHH